MLSLAAFGGGCLMWHLQCAVRPGDHAREGPGLLNLIIFFKQPKWFFSGFIPGRTDVEAETPILWPPGEKS